MELADYYGGRRMMARRMMGYGGASKQSPAYNQCVAQCKKNNAYVKRKPLTQAQRNARKGREPTEAQLLAREKFTNMVRNKSGDCNYQGVPGWTLKELRLHARAVGMKGYSTMKKGELCKNLQIYH